MSARFLAFSLSKGRAVRPVMRHWVLFNNLVFAVTSRNAGSSAAAFRNPALVVKGATQQQHKQQLLSLPSTTGRMHRHIRGKLLSVSTRAAIAASAGSYALPSSDWEAGKVHRERGRLHSYSRGWVRPSYPAAALSKAASSSKSNSNAGAGSAGPLGFRGPSETTSVADGMDSFVIDRCWHCGDYTSNPWNAYSCIEV